MFPFKIDLNPYCYCIKGVLHKVPAKSGSVTPGRLALAGHLMVPYHLETFALHCFFPQQWAAASMNLIGTDIIAIDETFFLVVAHFPSRKTRRAGFLSGLAHQGIFM
jgi:hypothetical protein